MRSLPLPLVRRLVPLNGLNESSLQTLLQQSDWPLVGKGQRLFSLSDYEESHMFLLSGVAELQYSTGTVVHTAEVPFPVGYGVSGLQHAKALTDCVYLRVSKTLLDRQLCWDHLAASIELDLSYNPEHDDESSWQLTLLKSNLFLKVPPSNFLHMFSCLKPMQVKAGDVILRQGEVGDGCYFIRRGRASITRQFSEDGADLHIMDIGYGRCFGEEALLHNTVRNASVTMTSDGQLMRLEKSDFMLLLREVDVENIKGGDIGSALRSGTILLDVRMEEEFNVAKLKNSINAPLDCLRLLMSEKMALHQDYIVYCDTGRRSRAAVSILKKQGFRARYLLNGINGLGPAQRSEFIDSAALS
jgi:rhodanese-related sulfurtransferase